MIKTDDDNNSICSDDEGKAESVIIKDKNNEDDDDDEENENEEDEDDKGDEDDEDEDEDEDDEEDEDDDDDNNEFDKTIIQFEMMKNFFIDKEGDNISTHLGSISHELRKLNKIAVKLLEKKN